MLFFLPLLCQLLLALSQLCQSSQYQPLGQVRVRGHQL